MSEFTDGEMKTMLREFRPVAEPAGSVLAGRFDIETIEQAFFNHDHDGSEPGPDQWEKRCAKWRSFKAYLTAHPRQEIASERLAGPIAASANANAKANNQQPNT